MITILTPTYNRAYILKKAYDSLMAQTCKEFEWIVVDDGSSDNTETLVQEWVSECNDFTIRYYKQKNGGKHRAVNVGVKYASYDYLLILDSDDYLTEDAVGKIHSWIKTIKNVECFGGVVGLRGYPNGNVIGGRPSSKWIDATFAERNKYKLNGDKAEVFKTELLKKYPFPEFDGEVFLPESASWDMMARDGYKFRFFNEIIYVCEYLPDGLTKATRESAHIKNFQGFTYCSKLHCEIYKFPYKHIRIGYYFKVAMLINKTRKEICESINISPFSLLLGRAIYSLNVIKNKIRKVMRG